MTREDLEKMTLEEKRIRIAEICGWKIEKVNIFICGETYAITNLNRDKFTLWMEQFRTDHSRTGWEDREHVFKTLVNVCEHGKLPDYLNDLNAIKEARNVLTPDQRVEYISNLYKVALWKLGIATEWTALADAAPDIHANAFLLTIG